MLYFCTYQNDFVAQLVEQLTLNQWVEGSSPSEVTGIIIKQSQLNVAAFFVFMPVLYCFRLGIYCTEIKEINFEGGCPNKKKSKAHKYFYTFVTFLFVPRLTK